MKRTDLLLLVFAAFLAGCNGRVEEDPEGVLVTADWLQHQLDDPSLVLLHSGSRALYDSIHIPGAGFIDPNEFVVKVGELNNEIPEADTIVRLLRAAGVNMDSKIVLYYDDERMISRTTRVFLAMDRAGLDERTRVLNGGLQGWIEDGRETTDLTTEIPEGDFRMVSPEKVVLSAAELDRERWNPGTIIVDVRSDNEYYGVLDSTGQHPTGGHIEGAYSLNYQLLLAENEPFRFKQDDALRELFGSVGLDKGKMSVYYCGSGVRASVAYLAAKHLGYDVKLYDGSFQEWDELDLPVTAPAVEPSHQNQQ